MGKSSPAAPAAPDPVATANAQGAVNKDTAQYNASLNNVNQITPYGNLTYSQAPTTYNNDAYQQALKDYNSQTKHATGSVAPTLSDYANAPQYTSTTTLSPEQQKLLDLENQGSIGTAQLGNDQLGRIANAVSTPYSYAGLGDAPSADDMATAQAKGQAAVMARLQPQQDHDQAALDAKLSNQGIQQGSEAYNDAYRQFNNAKTDADQQAVLTGQQYASQGQSDAEARRQQAITEYSTQRNAPLNEYSALTSGSQVQNPTFQSTSYTGAAPADLAGNVYKNYQGALNASSNSTASGNANTSATTGLIGTAAMAAMFF